MEASSKDLVQMHTSKRRTPKLYTSTLKRRYDENELFFENKSSSMKSFFSCEKLSTLLTPSVMVCIGANAKCKHKICLRNTLSV